MGSVSFGRFGREFAPGMQPVEALEIDYTTAGKCENGRGVLETTTAMMAEAKTTTTVDGEEFQLEGGSESASRMKLQGQQDSRTAGGGAGVNKNFS